MARMWGARVNGTSPRKSGTVGFTSVAGVAGGAAAMVGTAGAGLFGSTMGGVGARNWEGDRITEVC